MHEIETVDTRTIINEIMPKFYYYIVAEELAKNPYIEPPSMTTENRSFYSNEDTVVETKTTSRGWDILIENVESEFNVFCNEAAAQAAIKNEYVLTWYKERQLQFPMLSRLATIIFLYSPLKLKIRRTYTLKGFVALLVVQGCR